MINVYKWAVIDVNENQWVMLYNDDSKNILIAPIQAAGSYCAADTLVVADTKEELDQYIIDNDL